MSLPSGKVSDESLGRDETSCIGLATNNVLSQETVNFTVNYSVPNLLVCIRLLY